MQSVALHALQDSLSDIATKNVSTISIKLTHLILRKKSSDQKQELICEYKLALASLCWLSQDSLRLQRKMCRKLR